MTRKQIALRLQRLASRLANLSIAAGSGLHAASDEDIAVVVSNIEDELDSLASDEHQV